MLLKPLAVNTMGFTHFLFFAGQLTVEIDYCYSLVLFYFDLLRVLLEQELIIFDLIIQYQIHLLEFTDCVFFLPGLFDQPHNLLPFFIEQLFALVKARCCLPVHTALCFEFCCCFLNAIKIVELSHIGLVYSGVAVLARGFVGVPEESPHAIVADAVLLLRAHNHGSSVVIVEVALTKRALKFQFQAV